MIPINFFTDFSSPFAFLTLRYLVKIKDLYIPDLEITPLSFKYNITDNTSFKQLLTNHLKTSQEDIEMYYDDLKLIFLNEGINFNDNIIISDQTIAQVGLKFANKYQIGTNFAQLVYESVFIHGKDISDEEVIYNIIEDLQLDLNFFKEAISQDLFLPSIKQDHLLCKTLDIKVVPYMIVENQISIKQYYDYDSLLTVLLKIKDHLGL